LRIADAPDAAIFHRPSNGHDRRQWETAERCRRPSSSVRTDIVVAQVTASRHCFRHILIGLVRPRRIAGLIVFLTVACQGVGRAKEFPSSSLIVRILVPFAPHVPAAGIRWHFMLKDVGPKNLRLRDTLPRQTLTGRRSGGCAASATTRAAFRREAGH